MVRDILAAWDVPAKEIKEKERGWWEVDQIYNLKNYRSIRRAEDEAQKLEKMVKCGLPVEEVILTKSRGWCDPEGYLLTKKLVGSPVKTVDQENAGMLGRAIGQLDRALERYESAKSLWVRGLVDQLMNWEPVFREEGWKLVPQQDWKEVLGQLKGVTPDLPEQTVDQRIRVWNFLFEKGEFSGYASFFTLERDIRLLNLCNVLVRLLCEGYVNLDEEWVGIIKKVVAGYEKVRPLAIAEREALVYIMEYEALLFTAIALNSFDKQDKAQQAAKVFRAIREKENVL